MTAAGPAVNHYTTYLKTTRIRPYASSGFIFPFTCDTSTGVLVFDLEVSDTHIALVVQYFGKEGRSLHPLSARHFRVHRRRCGVRKEKDKGGVRGFNRLSRYRRLHARI
jgi:hypothetical protein